MFCFFSDLWCFLIITGDLQGLLLALCFRVATGSTMSIYRCYSGDPRWCKDVPGECPIAWTLFFVLFVFVSHPAMLMSYSGHSLKNSSRDIWATIADTQCLELNLGQLHASQMPYLLYNNPCFFVGGVRGLAQTTPGMFRPEEVSGMKLEWANSKANSLHDEL